jgi:Plavaka transposase
MDTNIEDDIPAPIPSPPSFVPIPTQSGRLRKFPARFKDFLPNTRTVVPHIPEPPSRLAPAPVSASSIPGFSSSPEPVSQAEEIQPNLQFVTEPDEFGLFRVYPRNPHHEFDEDLTLNDISDNLASSSENLDPHRWSKGFNPENHAKLIAEEATYGNPFFPLSNATSFRLLNWFYGGSSQKSQADLSSLVEDVLKANDYSQEDARNFKFNREMSLLDSPDESDSPFANENIWKTSTIKIPLPCEKTKFRSEADAPKLRVRNVRHRSLVQVLRTAVKDESAKSYHYTPFKMYWKRTPNSEPERVISELYTADAFWEEHEKIAKLPLCLPNDPPGLKPVETAVLGLMIWSDSTHLSSFGNASMWPTYLYIGNQSKYPRGKPSERSAHHIAYIPSVSIMLLMIFYLLIEKHQLPDNFQDKYMEKLGKAPSKPIETHLKRELIQKVWELLLDDDFMAAYEFGMVCDSADGHVRRYFPRFFTYSADYPEKCVNYPQVFP